VSKKEPSASDNVWWLDAALEDRKVGHLGDHFLYHTHIVDCGKRFVGVEVRWKRFGHWGTWEKVAAEVVE